MPQGRHFAVTWSIPDDYGGMTAAMLQRSSAFSRLGGTPVDVLTFDARPDTADLEVRLRERGVVDHGVRLVNLYDWLRGHPLPGGSLRPERDVFTPLGDADADGRPPARRHRDEPHPQRRAGPHPAGRPLPRRRHARAQRPARHAPPRRGRRPIGRALRRRRPPGAIVGAHLAALHGLARRADRRHAELHDRRQQDDRTVHGRVPAAARDHGARGARLASVGRRRRPPHPRVPASRVRAARRVRPRRRAHPQAGRRHRARRRARAEPRDDPELAARATPRRTRRARRSCVARSRPRAGARGADAAQARLARDRRDAARAHERRRAPASPRPFGSTSTATARAAPHSNDASATTRPCGCTDSIPTRGANWRPRRSCC